MKGSGEILLGSFEKGLGHRAADVVDDDIDATELVESLLSEGVEVLGPCRVAWDDKRAASELADLLSDGLELIGASCGEGNVGAILGEGECRRAADAPPGTGYEGDFVVYSKAVEDTHGDSLAG
jgi:hypothetical protein